MQVEIQGKLGTDLSSSGFENPIRLAKSVRFLQNSAHMKTTTFPLKHSLNRSHCRLALLIPLAFTCFALAPQVRAVCQDGCGASNANTFLGDDALINNPPGSDNTAIGFNALFSSTVTSFNTAFGSQALFI